MEIQATNASEELCENQLLPVSNQTSDEKGRNEEIAVFEVAVLGTIFLLALIGNLFVLVTLRHKNLRSRMYYFMFHLSLADLFVSFLNILPQFAWDITYRFRGGDLLCRAVKYGQVMPLYLSSYVLVAMALDRYRAICCLQQVKWSSLKIAKTMIFSSYVVSCVLAIPQIVLFRETEVNPGITDCWVTFEQPWGAKAYVTWFVLIVFVIPLLVIIWCYSMISYRIWKHSSDASRSSSESAADRQSRLRNDSSRCSDESSQSKICQPILRRSNSNRITRAKIKTIKMSLVVVLCFVACWLPFCVVQLILVYTPPENIYDVSAVVVVFQLLASLNSCTNPWIYLGFSGTLLNEIKKYFGCKKRLLRSDSVGLEGQVPVLDRKRADKDSDENVVKDLEDYPAIGESGKLTHSHSAEDKYS